MSLSIAVRYELTCGVEPKGPMDDDDDYDDYDDDDDALQTFDKHRRVIVTSFVPFLILGSNHMVHHRLRGFKMWAPRASAVQPSLCQWPQGSAGKRQARARSLGSSLLPPLLQGKSMGGSSVGRLFYYDRLIANDSAC